MGLANQAVTPGRTSLLEAVNICLAVIGEAPVNTLETQRVGEAAQAERTLLEYHKEGQTRGWSWNREWGVAFHRDATSGEVLIPASVVKWAPSRLDWNGRFQARGGRVYDSEGRSYAIPADIASIQADIVSLLPWDDCPEVFNRWATIRAARVFSNRAIGNTATYQLTQEDENQAWADLLRVDTEQSQPNAITGEESWATFRPSMGLGRRTGGGGGGMALGGAVRGGGGASPPGPGVTLPQDLGTTASPSFVGLTLSGQASNAGSLALFGTGGLVGPLPLGSGLAIVGGALTATGSGGGGGDGGSSGTVTSVGLVAPTGFDVTGSPVTGSGNLALSYAAGYSLPPNSSQANWNTAFAERLRWDGGSAGLVAATARTSLGLGTAAQAAVTDFATPSALALKADLVGGLVPTSQIPAIALVQYLGSVASQSAMLALRGQGGDWCIRTDGQASEWVIVANDGSALADWFQMPTGAAGVSSINGQTGAVTLGTGDLSESGGNLFFTAARAIGAALTGFTAEAGTVSASDSVLQAIQKMVGNIAGRALTGAIGSSGVTMNPARLLGRTTAGVGAPEEITVGSGLNLSGGTLTATGTGGGGAANDLYALNKSFCPFQGAVAVGAANPANTLAIIPFQVQRSGRVDALQLRVVTAVASSLFQIAFYASADGVPVGTPIGVTSSISGAASANLNETFGTPFNVIAERTYFLAANVSTGTTLAFLALPAGSLHSWNLCGPASIAGVNNTNAMFNYTISQTFGTWPDLTGATLGTAFGASRAPVAWLQYGAFV